MAGPAGPATAPGNRSRAARAFAAGLQPSQSHCDESSYRGPGRLRNLQTMVEIGVDKNSTIVFPAPLMSTIGELGAFLSRETKAATDAQSTKPVSGIAKTEQADGTPRANGELVST